MAGFQKRSGGTRNAAGPPLEGERSDPLRILIVDDEELARRVLREYIMRRSDCDVVGECANGFEAVKAVGELRPDLLLLDIQMPKLDGFEVLELLDRPVETIFVTAHEQHALRAFTVHAVDYLLKPVGEERLDAALARARGRIRAGSRPLPVRELVAAARPPGQHAGRILVRDGAKVHVLPVESIDYFEAQDDYVALRTAGKSLLKQQPLSEVETILDPARFVRIHRSYILNVDRLARIELYAKDSRVAILRDGTRLPVSRAGYQRLRELL